MKRALVVAIAAVVIAGITGCGAARVQIQALGQRIAIPADKPPSPATWPKYPHFSRHSCWGQPSGKGPRPLLTQMAPSYAPAPRAHPIPPSVVARRLLARFGDRRYVRSITLSPAGIARRFYPPADALKAEIVLRGLNMVHHPSPERILTNSIAQFEGDVVGGALRDDFCDAGGRPLVKWSAGNGGGGGAESWFALDQRFPNPSPAAFRERVALIGQRFGFTVASLRLLRPRQFAPVLVVKTRRTRKAFVKDIPKILRLLDPSSRAVTNGNVRNAATFEALFFAVEDAKGPFALTAGVGRDGESGSEWAANPCLLPLTFAGGPTEKQCP